MTKERLVSTIENLKDSKLHPADRRVMNEFLKKKKEEIALKYFKLAQRMREPERDENDTTP